MKEATLHALITAKALFEDAKALCASGNSHSATAGVIILQDALELVLLAALTEKEIDNASKTEKLTFDQIIGNLRAGDVDVPKSGTLKSLNRHRVLAKHYGQLVLPETVRGYLEASQAAIDRVLQQVVGKTLDDIFLTDLLNAGEAKNLLLEALRHLQQGNFLDSLISTRKAIFVEIEQEYSVHKWAGVGGQPSLAAYFLNGGRKALSHTRNPEWIAKNVKEPTQYVQIDRNQLRADAVEWGVNTNDLLNLRWLTPNVFRDVDGAHWCISYETDFPANEANATNAQYCLGRAIAILFKKQMHAEVLRYPQRNASFTPPPVYLGNDVFERAEVSSRVVHVVTNGYQYLVKKRVTSFDGNTIFYYVTAHPVEEPSWSERSIEGFLVEQADNTLPIDPTVDDAPSADS